MDIPAEIDAIKRAVANQGQILGQHENLLKNIDAVVAQLLAAQTKGQAAVNLQPSIAAVTPREPHVQPPERYSGESGSSCRGFLSQCSLLFTLQPSAFTTDVGKVRYVMTLLTGRALAWANALIERDSDLCSDFDQFIEEMKRIFDCPVRGRDAATRLLVLRQGRNSVKDYAIEFQVLAAESEWPMATLMPVFMNGLSEEIKDELASREYHDLDALVTLATQVDNRISQRRRERQMMRTPVSNERHQILPPMVPDYSRIVTKSSASADSSSSSEEPMQLGHTRLSYKEKTRRKTKGLCLYCGESGHLLGSCPVRPDNQGNGGAQL